MVFIRSRIPDTTKPLVELAPQALRMLRIGRIRVAANVIPCGGERSVERIGAVVRQDFSHSLQRGRHEWISMHKISLSGFICLRG
jgi:hypothetical protein